MTEESIPRCVICNCEITESNNSDEHIIPNAIGGRKTVRNFICRKCNNETGRKWDDKLCKSLNLFCVMFNIKRDNKPVPPIQIKRNGKGGARMHRTGEITLPPTSDFSLKQISDNEFHLRFQAGDMDEARKKLEKIKEKHHFDYDTEQVLKDSDHYEEIGNIEIETGIGGTPSELSVIKTALAFAFSNNFPIRKLTNAFISLKTKEPEKVLKHYSGESLFQKDDETILHGIIIFNKNNNLFAYVEYFSFLKFVILLQENCETNDIYQYAINIEEGTPLDIPINENILQNYEEHICGIDKYYSEYIEKSTNQILKVGLPKLEARRNAPLIKEAINTAIEKSGVKENELFTSDGIKKIKQIAMEELYKVFIPPKVE